MFGFFKTKKAEVLSHWYALIPGFQTSSQEFYTSIERELAARKVPGLDLSQVNFAEGGLLSAKRVYLRMLRERLVFDVCAAPFGTGYFFSCRFAEIPAVVKWWEILILLFGLNFLLGLFIRIFNFLDGPIYFFLFCVFCIWVMRNAISMGLTDLDATLIKTPVIGPIYERFLRKDTYYRQDTRLMYHDTVNDIVKREVEHITGANGIKLVQLKVFSPIIDELYKTTPIPPSAPLA